MSIRVKEKEKADLEYNMLVGVLENINDLTYLESYLDLILIRSKSFSSYYTNTFELDEIINISKLTKRNILLDISIMLENKDINLLDEIISKLKDYQNIYYLYMDLGLYNVLKKYNIENKGIYDPRTLITNNLDCKFYLDYNMLSVGISNEITVSDMQKIIKDNDSKVFLRAFGYHQMFYSKRRLISLYGEHIKKNIEIDNLNMYLKEDKREDFYHIFESNKGTLIFRPYILSYLDEILDLNPKFVFLDDIFMDKNDYFKVIKLFDAKFKEKTLDYTLSDLKLTLNDGFKYKDTVYQKEK